MSPWTSGHGGAKRWDWIRQSDGKWVGAQCGAALDVPTDADPKTVIHAASGRPNVRVLPTAGSEIHRCDLK
jgi:hypothetical protein